MPHTADGWETGCRRPTASSRVLPRRTDEGRDGLVHRALKKSYPIHTENFGLRNDSLPPWKAKSASSHSLLNSVFHAQSKWMGKPRANVWRPMPYDARPSRRRKPEISLGGPNTCSICPKAFCRKSMTGVITSELDVANWNGVLLNDAPPTLKNAVPLMPPMTPMGVSIASISGNRSSAFPKNALWPMNSRYR
jgi:hypothetical protein